MAKKVLTEEDFKEEKGKEETSSKEEIIPADQLIDQDGKVIEEEPEQKPETSEKVKEEPEPKSLKEEPEPKSLEEKKFKYTSLDEYDKAYKEAERKMHGATTELAEIKRKLAQYEKPPEKPSTIDDHMAQIADEALKDISLLPQDSQTRDRDAAIIWVKAQRKISRMETQEVNKQVETERQIVGRLYDRATEEGWVNKENGKKEGELRILGQEYDRADPNLSIDERIEKATESTKKIISKIREGFLKDQERDKKEKENLRFLGRGSSRKETEEKETKSSTMTQQLAELNEKRRMTKEDLR